MPLPFLLIPVFFSVLSHFSTTVLSAGFFPCHPVKSQPPSNVSCTHVRLPSSLCRTCSLRPPLPDGQFDNCDDIYDTSSSACHADLRLYKKLNPCDTQRSSAIDIFLSSGHQSARSQIDYLLYSLCENCCDCIPMGRKLSDYEALSKVHDPFDKQTKHDLWDVQRGNCPAHAVYDICKVLPKVTYFSRVDTQTMVESTTFKTNDDDDKHACTALRIWLSSSYSEQWQQNPRTTLTEATKRFLNSLLYASDCSHKDTWQKCFDLESRQQHLNLPNGSTLPAVTPPSKTSTPTATPSASTSPSPSSSMSPSVTPSPPEVEFTATSLPEFTTEISMSVNHSPFVVDESSTPLSPSLSPQISDTFHSPSISDDDSASVETSISSSFSSSPSTLNLATCFPSSAVVSLLDGSVRPIWTIPVGTLVLSSPGKYSPIFLYTHRDANAIHDDFVRITTKSNHSLTLTATHYVNDVKPARDIQPGFRLQLADGTWTTVTSMKRHVKGQGLFNPQTIDGTIVIDGVVVSCYTSTTVTRSERTAHALLAPMRALFGMGMVTEATAGTIWNHGVI